LHISTFKMKKTLLKIAVFAAILGLVKLPFALTGEDELTFRRAAFARQSFSAVFIGSSRTKMGVIPAYFDSLTRGEMHSYNFGIEAGVPPYTFDWCGELIESGASLKYIFIELSGGEKLNVQLRAPWRRFVWQEYLAEVKIMSFAESQKYHNQLALSLFKPGLAENTDVIGYNLPLAEALKGRSLGVKKTPLPEELLLARQRNQTVESADADYSLKESYWLRVRRLVELAEAKGIRIYFFIPPRLETDDELVEMYRVYQKLEDKYKLKVNHYEDALYTEETSVDKFHLNHAGALRFTENFAAAFNEREF
jgi:hypothetical protein